jgi:hypothetical protein
MEITFYSQEVAMATNSLYLLIIAEYYLIRWEWRYLFLYANCIALFLSKFRNTVLNLNRMLQNVHLPLLPGTSFKTNVSCSVYCFCVLINVTCTNKVGYSVYYETYKVCLLINLGIN